MNNFQGLGGLAGNAGSDAKNGKIPNELGFRLRE